MLKRLPDQPTELMLPDAVRSYFEHGDFPARHPDGRPAEGGWEALGLMAHDDDAKARWLNVRDELLGAWVASRPGSRPWATWRFDMPRWPRAAWPLHLQDRDSWEGLLAEPRRRVGGVGTARFHVLAVFPDLERGIPREWVTPEDVRHFRGEGRALYAAFAGAALGRPEFAGVAPDPRNPPTFECEAAYLRRHGLLLPGEAQRLTAADFEPETVTVDGAAARATEREHDA